MDLGGYVELGADDVKIKSEEIDKDFDEFTEKYDDAFKELAK
jgi:hypothetical protein